MTQIKNINAMQELTEVQEDMADTHDKFHNKSLKGKKGFGGTLDDAECMKLTGLARNTYYKYKRQIREEQEAAKSMRPME